MSQMFIFLAALLAATSVPMKAAAAELEFDHVWIVVSRDAPERAALERAGLKISPGVNRNDGQGTASVQRSTFKRLAFVTRFSYKPIWICESSDKNWNKGETPYAHPNPHTHAGAFLCLIPKVGSSFRFPFCLLSAFQVTGLKAAPLQRLC